MTYQEALELSRPGPFDYGCAIGLHVGPGGMPDVEIVLHDRLQLPCMLYKMRYDSQWLFGRTTMESLEAIDNWMPIMPGTQVRSDLEEIAENYAE